MKNFLTIFRNLKVAVISAVIGFAGCGYITAENLVLLHTNDTHSLIDPDEAGRGGVLQRKAIIDSVRKAEKNVILIDAGDVVQGTLYFKFFKGDVEFPLMNMMGYDIQILGNHEFDNGMQQLAPYYKSLNADKLSANYDLSDTPLSGLLQPFVIKKIGGKKIGFFGINTDPASLIANANYEGLRFLDPVTTANATADYLREKENCDLIIAVTHIGARKENEKPTDYELAASSRNIDIIIGGHSHNVISPALHDPGFESVALNIEGRPVAIAQTGKYGKYLGYINIDLDSPDPISTDNVIRRLIPVTDRFPGEMLDRNMEDFIRPYRERLEAVNNNVIGVAEYAMDCNDRTGSYVNWAADFAKWYGDLIADSIKSANPTDKLIPQVDFAMMNVGGIRHDLPAGDITEGHILSTFPFANRMVIVRIKGRDFIDAMKIAAAKGGEAVSDQIRVVLDADRPDSPIEVLVGMKPMDPDKDYYFSTINYLAWGNDDFTPLARGEIIWKDDKEMSAPMMRYIHMLSDLGLPVAGDPRPRFVNKIAVSGHDRQTPVNSSKADK
ncbi:MAG: bifunctional metallophosphatase/5'-nucleotidase [Muribaculaceae bacterium]|nr:bifunctional metallophosphatase/5'-nucleotidase [Muribaculaceae bacterium]